jgi:O-acetyl-ADP-ribose deacetylase (regulator of RNase III)
MIDSTRRKALKIAGGALSVGVFGTGLASADHDAATVTFEDQQARGASVNVASVYLPHGGFVVLHDARSDFRVIGHTQSLPAGTHTDVNVAIKRGAVRKQDRRKDGTLVAMPHRDTGIEGKYEFPDADPPYFNTPGDSSSGAVVDPAFITFP